VSGLTEEDRRDVWDKMSSFEGMSVAQLNTQGSHHRVTVSSLSKTAKARLRELQLEDLGELWSFRITSSKRFWCIKHENIYALIWWDPHHKVYPVPKKRT
jgi:hypothetical protein